MHPNAELIRRFYDSFARRDAAGMAACYHPAVRFSDPVFPALQGEEAKAMWAMLCSQARDFELRLVSCEADEKQGTAHWEADYTFSQTGRKVKNVVTAKVSFADGLIVNHADSFDFWRWSRMALGVPGVLLGWTPLLQGAVRKKAAAGLKKFRERAQA